MTSYNDFEAYFEELVDEFPEIASVTFVTNWVDIMELQLQPNLYPTLVIETPQIKIGDNGGLTLGFQGAFSIIHGMPTNGKREVYRQKLHELANIMIKVHQRIFCDSEEEDRFNADLDDTLDPITGGVTRDNAYGWRGYFKITNQ